MHTCSFLVVVSLYGHVLFFFPVQLAPSVLITTSIQIHQNCAVWWLKVDSLSPTLPRTAAAKK